MAVKKVTLTNVGNIDHGQDPSKPLVGTQVGYSECSSFKEASQLCRAYIERHNLGSGNFTGGAIFDENDVQIAYVSYNGRVWEGTEYKAGNKEIDIDNE